MIRALALCGLALIPVAAEAQVCMSWRALTGSHRTFTMPASSMHPTIMSDTCIEARMLGEEELNQPAGSVIVFRHPSQEADFVKRIVAVGGQSVQMIDGVLHIDGAAVGLTPLPDFAEVFERSASGGLPRCPSPVELGETCAIPQFRESLPNGASYAILDIEAGSAFDNTALYEVPAGHVFVIGDNRDNSLDSRMPPPTGVGLLPVENIIGVFDDLAPGVLR